jgi:hypothetical protein
MRLLEKDPAARFQTAAELRNALVAAGAAAPVTRPPPAAGAGDIATTPTISSRPPIATPTPARTRDTPEAYTPTMAMTTNHGAAAEVVRDAKPRSKAALWIVLGGGAIAAAAVAAFVIGRGQSEGGDTKTSQPPTQPSGIDAAAEVATTPPDAAAAETPPPLDGPTFRIDAQTIARGATIAIAFDRPMVSIATNQAWVTVVRADRADNEYDSWQFVENGARTMKVKAPDASGTFEVRLHTEYPRKQTNLVYRARLAIVDPQDLPSTPSVSTVTPRDRQKFSLGSKTVAVGGTIQIKFPTAMIAEKGEQFWITVIDATASDSTWGAYEYVKPKAKKMTLAAPTKPGAYQVRLHANYPKMTTNVVHRVAITVE